MARLFGIQLPDDKRAVYALTIIYGIGWQRSRTILGEMKIDETVRIKDLTEDQLKLLVQLVEKRWKVEGDLREENNEQIKRYKEIGSYRGLRHISGLPVRGQRTKSNARTRKGKRKTVGALTKEAWAKLETIQNSSKK